MTPIIFHIQSFYKEIYIIGSKLPKRDKLGLHAVVEKICIKILTLSIKASLENKGSKQRTLKQLRINIETLKRLIRAELELKIIKENSYLLVQEKLQEISKEAVGWEKYAHKSSPQRELL
ncbi:MAG: four helix bundle protein [Patescibacteria group bacterium]